MARERIGRRCTRPERPEPGFLSGIRIGQRPRKARQSEEPPCHLQKLGRDASFSDPSGVVQEDTERGTSLAADAAAVEYAAQSNAEATGEHAHGHVIEQRAGRNARQRRCCERCRDEGEQRTEDAQPAGIPVPQCARRIGREVHRAHVPRRDTCALRSPRRARTPSPPNRRAVATARTGLPSEQSRGCPRRSQRPERLCTS